MKYYSERLNRLYDTEEELFRAERILDGVCGQKEKTARRPNHDDFSRPATTSSKINSNHSSTDDTAFRAAIILLLLNYF